MTEYHPHTYKRVKAWGRCTDCLGNLHEPGETFVDRIYTEHEESPCKEIIGDAEPHEIAAIEARSKPLKRIPGHQMPPDGPKVSAHIHEPGPWWSDAAKAREARAHHAAHQQRHREQKSTSYTEIQTGKKDEVL